LPLQALWPISQEVMHNTFESHGVSVMNLCGRIATFEAVFLPNNLDFVLAQWRRDEHIKRKNLWFDAS